MLLTSARQTLGAATRGPRERHVGTGNEAAQVPSDDWEGCLTVATVEFAAIGERQTTEPKQEEVS